MCTRYLHSMHDLPALYSLAPGAAELFHMRHIVRIFESVRLGMADLALATASHRLTSPVTQRIEGFPTQSSTAPIF
jgi:hypothetical protein